MKMAPNNGKKIKYFISVLLIVGSFLFISISPTYALLNDYNKPYNGTLSATEWNNLDNDFLNRTGVASMEGPLSITAGGLTVNGTVSATSFAGALSARNVSSGIFGIDQGGGNFMFPGNLAVGTTNPAGYTLDVSGDINFTGTLRQNGTVFTGSKWTSNALNIYYNTGNVGIGLTNPGQQLDVNLGLRAQSLILKGFAGAAGIVMTDAAGLLYSATSPEGNITLPGGTNGATLRYDSTSGNWLSNTFLFNSGTGIGIGTEEPGSPLTIINNGWISARNSADTGIVNMFKVNSSNQIEVGAPLIIGPLEFAEDSGLVSFLDMPVTSSAALGTPEGYTMKIDGNNLFTLYSESNGAGGVQNMRLGVGTTNPTGDLTIGGTGTRSISRDRSTGNLDLYGGSTYTDGAYFKVTGSTLNTSPGNSSGEFTIGEYTGTYASTFKINSFNGSTWTPRFLVMGSTGNVGIGVTNPIEMLHVGGTAQFDDVAMGVTPGSTQSLALTTVEYVNNMVTGVSTSTVGYWSANGTNIYNANSGNVGIGITNPANKFDVNGGVRVRGALDMYSNNIESFDNLIFHPTAGSSGVIESNNALGITFRLNGSNVLKLTNSGNVGIGTTAPWSKTTIRGVSSAPSLVRGAPSIFSVSATNGVEFAFTTAAAWPWTGSIQVRDIPEGTSDAAYPLALNPLGGNVGINTANPTRTLHVNGGAQLDSVSFGVTPGESQDLALTTVEYVNSKVGGEGGIEAGTSGQTLRHNGTSWVANSILYNDGTNIGIGKTNPTVELDVAGSAFFGVTNQLKIFEYSDTLTIQATEAIDDNSKKPITFNPWGGNVGIGTLNPTSELTLGGTGTKSIGRDTTSGNLDLYGGSSYANGAYFKVTGSTLNAAPGNSSGEFTIGEETGTYASNFKVNSFNGSTWTTRFVVIGSSGNVGIGKTNPVYKLDVAGTANFDGLATGVTPGTTQKLAFTTVEYVDGMISGVSTSTVGYWSANGTNIYNANSGNVGIGTTNPISKVTIQTADTTSNIPLVVGQPLNAGEYTGIGFQGYIAGNAAIKAGIIQTRTATYGVGNLQFALNNVLDNSSFTLSDVKMTIQPTGNIGIGTTNPSALLAVGNQSFSAAAPQSDPSPRMIFDNVYDSLGNPSPNKWVFYNSGTWMGGIGMSSGDFDLFSGGNYRFHTGANSITSVGIEVMVIQQNGNVGISTTTPTQKLHVNGGAQLDAISFGVTPGESQTLALTTVEYVNAKVGGSAGITTGTTGQTLRHDGTGWVANSVLYNNGTNIGIGTTNPGRKVSILDSYDNSIVEPNSDPSGLIVQNLGNGSHTVTNFHTSIALKTFDDSWHIRATEIANNNLDLSFGHQYSTEATFNEKLRITSAGNVGMGTIAPAAKLDIVGTGATLRIAEGEGSENYSARLQARTNYSNSFNLFAGTQEIITRRSGNLALLNYTNFEIQTYTTSYNSGNTRFYIQQNGNVGIATTNPTQKLHVNGGAQLDSVSFGVTPGTTQKLALATVEYIDNMISGVSTSTVGYWSANGNHIYNANSANVGIGSSAPANKLDISGSLGIDGILKGYGSANGNFFEGKLGVNSLSAGASSLAVFGNAAIGTSYLSTSAPINGLIVQGNVGIATSTPAEALHIVGNLRVDGGATISGNLNMSGSTLIVNKITANTIDPLYTIGGVKYSTFAPSIVGGVKEEYVGRIYEDDFRKVGVEYEAVIDMSKLEEGSDLWVWHKVVDFSSDNVSVFLTPKGERASMYADIEGDKIVIRSDRVVDAYLRLIGSRYDWHEWPTKASDQNQPGGLLIN